MEGLTLRELSLRLAIPVSRLRYVVNKKVVPSIDWSVGEDEVGQPLHFDLDTAKRIGCAALLMQAGQKRNSVREIMQALQRMERMDLQQMQSPTIPRQGRSQAIDVVQVGDGVRFRRGTGGWDSGWLILGPPITLAPNFSPKICLTLDFEQIDLLLRA